MPADCSVSFIVTSRNDDHGGDMLRRFQLFADALLEQANRHSLSGELIVVEWNPPSGPRLHEALKLRVKSDCFAVRFIEVPLEAHGKIRNADAIPLFQMIAKNVGIRRAQGEFVLATNPDLFFSDSLISFLASGKLLKDVMYRIDRHDVRAEVPDNTSIDNQLAWCAVNVLRVHRRRGSFPPTRRLLSRLWILDPSIWVKTRRALWKNVWYRVWYLKLAIRRAPRRWRFLCRQFRNLNRGLIRNLLVRLRERSGRRRMLRRVLWRFSDSLQRFGHLIRIGARRLMARCRLLLYSPRLLIRRMLWGALRLTDPLPKVHTNGCGDFTLMSSARWFELRGYPELPLWSMHVDSLLCYMAVASGLREHVLRPPAKLFHMEHHNSWVVMSPEERLRTFSKKPWIDIGLLSELWHNMYSTRCPIQFNTDSWGLADWPLNEVILRSGEKQHLTQTPRAQLKGDHSWDLTDHRPSRPSLSSV
jgi:hypothetical protein